MAVATASPERALRQPARVDGRKVAGLFIFCLAVVGGLLYWQSITDLRPLVLATRDLPAGATLAGSDLATARLHADDTVYGAAIPGEELAGLVGRQLAEPVHAGQLLVRAQLASGPR